MQVIGLLLFGMVIGYGVCHFTEKMAECPVAAVCTEVTETVYQNVTEYLPMQCPVIPACPACNCVCSTKATADKSIHFNKPLTQCVNYNTKYPTVRVRGNDLITYRWWDCSKSEWVEGDVDEDGWLKV